jgi:hypothetical protein
MVAFNLRFYVFKNTLTWFAGTMLLLSKKGKLNFDNDKRFVARATQNLNVSVDASS